MLTIGSPSPQGVFLGRLLETDIRGFWDEGAQKIAFNLTVGFEGSVPSIASFNGFLLRTPPAGAAPELDVTATLTGYFQIEFQFCSLYRSRNFAAQRFRLVRPDC